MCPSLVEKSLSFDASAIDILDALREETGVSVSGEIRGALAARIAKRAHHPDDLSDFAIVRRALLSGGSWTTCSDEVGTNIHGQWRDPITQKRVDITGIVYCGKPRHCAASVGLNTFNVEEVLSKIELAGANAALNVLAAKARLQTQFALERLALPNRP